jgi:hypothetical protein
MCLLKVQIWPVLYVTLIICVFYLRFNFQWFLVIQDVKIYCQLQNCQTGNTFDTNVTVFIEYSFLTVSLVEKNGHKFVRRQIWHMICLPIKGSMKESIEELPLSLSHVQKLFIPGFPTVLHIFSGKE